jgi:hypothetical protein
VTTPLRVIGLVDGFNLYHSLQDDPGHKWLDLGKLLTGLLHCYPSPAKLVDIHYFTALPFYLQQTNPGRLSRHQIYLRALSARRNPLVTTHLGEIRQHQLEVAIPGGKTWTKVWREKGTDIALAVTLFELAAADSFDAAIIVSGDSDYAPLAKGFQRMHPGKDLRFAFPYRRRSNELLRADPSSIVLGPQHYQASRLPETIRLPSGKKLHCPSEWSRADAR